MPLSPLAADRLAWISLGANLGHSRTTLTRAMEKLEALSARPLVRSSIFQTEPVDCPPSSPLFSNAVVGLSPREGETAENLLGQLQQIEKEFGRRRSGVRNEPRSLDLDLIAFKRERRRSVQLMLPHPRAHLRKFVLQPLVEVAPNYVLPGRRRNVRALLRALQGR